MTAERPLRDKLRKVEALSADAAATHGEKAAAAAAADRIRAKEIAAAQGGGAAKPEPDLMFLLGRATRKLLSRLK